MPVFWMLRTAVSRPEPGPFTCTSTRRRPCSIAARVASSAAIWAANGVLLRDPLKPTPPDDAHEMTLPSVSVMETMVLLNELLMWTTPSAAAYSGAWLAGAATARLWLRHYFLTAFFLLATVFSGPYGYGRWCGCAGHARAGPCGDACPGEPDLDLALDVLRHVAAQVALDGDVRIHPDTDLVDLVLGEVANTLVRVLSPVSTQMRCAVGLPISRCR